MSTNQISAIEITRPEAIAVPGGVYLLLPLSTPPRCPRHIRRLLQHRSLRLRLHLRVQDHRRGALRRARPATRPHHWRRDP